MTKEKQIEEMTNDYYEAMLKASETLGSMNEGAPKWYAKELYAKGYRKESEVAREISKEIMKMAEQYGAGVLFWNKMQKFALNLEKEYTEEKKDNG